MTERERHRLLREAADRILAPLPAWDGESPAVLVTAVDPVTRNRLNHKFVPASKTGSVRGLRLVSEPDPEHGRAKEPLPIRPPRPHPQGVTL
ncbi:hypothetical protein ACWF8U_20415 [Streptomyces olivaceus]